MTELTRDLRRSTGVFLVLAGALAASAVLSRVTAGTVGTVLGLAIAGGKAGLIALFFMRLREQRGLTRLAAVAGLAWLALLLVLMLADYETRGWRTTPSFPVSSAADTLRPPASGNSP